MDSALDRKSESLVVASQKILGRSRPENDGRRGKMRVTVDGFSDSLRTKLAVARSKRPNSYRCDNLHFSHLVSTILTATGGETLHVTDEEFFRFTKSGRSGVPSLSGQRVRISRGQLAGLTGAVVALRPQQKCVVKIDAAEGVFVVIDDAALERTEGQGCAVR